MLKPSNKNRRRVLKGARTAEEVAIAVAELNTKLCITFPVQRLHDADLEGSLKDGYEHLMSPVHFD